MTAVGGGTFPAHAQTAAAEDSNTAGAEDILREHRAIWASPLLSNNWPSSKILESNAAGLKATIDKRLKIFRNDGINVIYYHARPNCDATYESSYEPWSARISGSRGAKPAFDPFGYLVESAHAIGIEVYAWVNPFRYTSDEMYGPGERNYETTHPDWLLTVPGKGAILNPGLPEVRQRVVDVISEIVTKYDVDGVLFDDYFYINSTPDELDADLWKAYKANKGTLDQDGWRRENVNIFVEEVYKAIKKIKPYCVFAISPPGTVSPPDVGDYGLTPGPHGDWQYDGQHSDPLKWLSRGIIDYLSPQVYWSEKYDDLVEWYSVAVPHFDRHLYTSLYASSLVSWKAPEFVRQIAVSRRHLRPNQNGMAFFEYGPYVNYRGSYDDFKGSFGEILAHTVFPHKVLTPLRHWNTEFAPMMVSNVRREGDKVMWDAPAGYTGGRYTVYAVPASEVAGFAGQRKYLEAVSYSTSFTPEAAAGADVKYAVSVYDRYGNEYSPLFEGESVKQSSGAGARLSYPESGAEPADLFDFKWEAPAEGAGRYLVEVSETQDFARILGVNESYEPSIASTALAEFEDGKTYWWRVRTFTPNTMGNVSEARSFVSSRLSIKSPSAGATEVSITPEIEWEAAWPGCSYKLEVSRNNSFTLIEYSCETSETKAVVPERVFVSGRTYYARVTATRGMARSVSKAVSFSTLDRTDYPAPTILNPSASGQTLLADDCIEVAPWSGMTSISFAISASSSFPSRSSFAGTLSGFETRSKELGSVKINGKNLVDGATYYLRARGVYSLTSSQSSQYTDYTPVLSFVYSSASGVSDVETSDAEAYVDSDCVLRLAGCEAESVAVYDLAGRCLLLVENPGSELELKHMPKGAYIIRIEGPNNSAIKWVR